MFPLLPPENVKNFAESLNIGYKHIRTFETTGLKIQVLYYRLANNQLMSMHNGK